MLAALAALIFTPASPCAGHDARMENDNERRKLTRQQLYDLVW